jgi:hypothetical protein
MALFLPEALIPNVSANHASWIMPDDDAQIVKDAATANVSDAK